MASTNIAIVTTDSLSFLGMRGLLQCMHALELSHYKTFADFLDGEPDKFDIIMPDSEVFVENVDYFMPRRGKTIVIAGRNKGNSSFFQINRYDDEEHIQEVLDSFIDQCASTTSAQSDLSQREIDVLKLVASGYINKEIADTLQISINTVLTHRKNITAKLGIKSVSGLSVYAMMNGYLTNL